MGPLDSPRGLTIDDSTMDFESDWNVLFSKLRRPNMTFTFSHGPYFSGSKR